MDLADYLRIYLTDHRAGQAAIVRVAHRFARSNRATPWELELSRLADDIEADAAVLDSVAEACAVEGGKAKRLLALAGERMGRLKLNGHILTYSPLSRVFEAEGLAAAAALKRQMWRTLERLQHRHAALADFDFAELADRATSQAEVLQRIHEWAADQLAGRPSNVST